MTKQNAFFLSILLSKWYLFVLSIILFLSIGSFFVARKPVIYESNASILIRVQNRAPEEMILLPELARNGGGNSKRDNEIGIIKSQNLVHMVVTSLKLNTIYSRERKLGLYSPPLYKKSPLYVAMQNVVPQDIPGTITLVFTPTGTSSSQESFAVEATYNLLGEKRTELLQIENLPTTLELDIGKFYVARQDPTSNIKQTIPFGNKPLKVVIHNSIRVAHNYIRDLEVGNTNRSSSLLYLTLKSKHKELGQDFISALISAYNLESANDKNMVAHNTSLFINKRIEQVAIELREIENKVESFRQKYNVTDLETQVNSYIRRGEDYKERLLKIETQLNLVRYIKEYINDPKNANEIIPNLGLNDANLVELIDNHNSLLSKRSRIQASSSAENPALKQINQQVAILKENIRIATSNEVKASEIALTNLEREGVATAIKIESVPTIERQFINIEREQIVKSNLYKYLLQKREETHLTQAAISPKAKIVTRPFSENRPIAPLKKFILGIFFILGIAIPGAILFLIDYFQTEITGPEELRKLVDINTVGTIATSPITKRYSLVIKEKDNSQLGEMFRDLRNNLLFMTSERDQNIILVTSTIPKEGKTFISANLALSLTLREKKVLLIGADLRNPQTGNSVGIPKRSIGLSSYLAGHLKDYHQLIEQVKGQDNLYIIQAGAIPPNPNELFSGDRIGNFLNEIKKEFDYVVIDSAPVGVVSDTFLLSRYTHATLYVIRQNFSQKDSIPFLNNLAQDKRLKNVGVVLNQATISHSNYGKYKYYR